MGGGGQVNYSSDPKKNQLIQDEVNLRNSIKINNGEAGLDQYLDGYNDAAKEGFYAKLNPSNWLKSKEEIFQEAMNEIKDKPEAYKIGYAKIFAETYGLPEKAFLNGAILGATGYIGVKGLTGASTENVIINRSGQGAKGGKYGTTPGGRPFTKHYAIETGPKRNIPGSVVDDVINNNTGKSINGGKTVYYDSKNNVTVITGDGNSIVSGHKGKPRKGQY